MKNALILVIITLLNGCITSKKVTKKSITETTYPKSYANMNYYTKLALKVELYHSNRLISLNQFLEMAKDSNTIILDSRSKEMYNKLHIKGAINLNFSDFNEKSLVQTITDTNKRILIYCNNNFIQKKSIIHDVFTRKKKGQLNSFRPSKKEKEVKQLSEINPTNNESTFLKTIDESNKKEIISNNLIPETFALNIPVFINLYGYGYKNVYELDQLINLNSVSTEGILKSKFDN